MERRHWGQHDDDCFACRVQTIQIDPRATPSRRNNIEPRRPDPAWERGIPTDSRGMPYLTKDGSPMGVKEFGENRHRIEEHRRQLHNSPDPIQLPGVN